MSYDEFLRQLGKAGINNVEFASMMKMHRNSLSHHAKKGKVPSHLAVIAVLIAEMAEHGLDYRAVISNISIRSKKPRGSGFKKGNKRSLKLPYY